MAFFQKEFLWLTFLLIYNGYLNETHNATKMVRCRSSFIAVAVEKTRFHSFISKSHHRSSTDYTKEEIVWIVGIHLIICSIIFTQWTELQLKCDFSISICQMIWNLPKTFDSLEPVLLLTGLNSLLVLSMNVYNLDTVYLNYLCCITNILNLFT